MTDCGDGLPLLGGGGGEQRAGAAEEDIFPAALPHSVEQQPGEHHRRAPAPGSPTVYVLLLQIVNEHTAVSQISQVHAVLVEEIKDDFPAQLAQVAGDNQVVIRGLAAGVLKVGLYGGVGGGGRCSIRPIKINRLLSMQHVLQANQEVSGIRPDI